MRSVHVITGPPEAQKRKLGVQLLTELLTRVNEKCRRLFAIKIRAAMGEGRIDLNLT